jgi:hypothetical protein
MDWTSDASTRTLTLLREALMSYPALTPSLSHAAAPSRDLLRSQMEQVWNAYRASRFALATTQLPRVIAGAKAALREGDTSESRRDGQRMLALVRNCLDCLGRHWPCPPVARPACRGHLHRSSDSPRARTAAEPKRRLSLLAGLVSWRESCSSGATPA